MDEKENYKLNITSSFPSRIIKLVEPVPSSLPPLLTFSSREGMEDSLRLCALAMARRASVIPALTTQP